MDFDTIIDRRGTYSSKWDKMEKLYGVSPDDGLAMWVADMDFRSPDVIQNRLRDAVERGMFGYVNFDDVYLDAIRWWMKERHNWVVDPSWVYTTTGVVNGVGMCLDAFTQPGDGIILFTPVYHAFARTIRGADRDVVEMPMPVENGRYVMDFDAYDKMITGKEKMVILCSPHNPGGTVWRQDELQAVADFADRHDLVLVSDEIHHDLVYPGESHIPMPLAVPEIKNRLVMLTAPSKTFNIAGLHTGHVIIEDPALRGQFSKRMRAISLASNSLGQFATAAAYSPDGATWVDALMVYLDGNRNLFDAAIADIPGLSSMRMQATYLSWVDFSATGMQPDEFLHRIEKVARIAVNHGDTFGTGGEFCARFNIATPRSRIEDACNRLRAAFADLQ